MRADIVPGAIFTDYELFDHTTKRRNCGRITSRAEKIPTRLDITTPELKAAGLKGGKNSSIHTARHLSKRSLKKTRTNKTP